MLRTMRIRPLGWELTFVIASVGAFLVAELLRSEVLVTAVVTTWALLTPVILLSALLRLVVGIAGELGFSVVRTSRARRRI